MRNIIKIDEEKCDGCGLCVKACAEGAIQIINGKAKLVSETYCDGLGACIGHCPQDAITIEQRDAAEFDEQATKAHLAQQEAQQAQTDFICPGMMTKQLQKKTRPTSGSPAQVPSQLTHWPIQLKLVSPHAPYFKNADLLLVADCVPFAMGDFHNRFLKDHSVVVGCPKLDDQDPYIEKLAAIIKLNNLRSVTVVHMEVPCCSGLTRIAEQAVMTVGAKMVFKDVTVALSGDILAEEKMELVPEKERAAQND